MSTFYQRLHALSPDILRSLKRGIEKESLRVRADGRLADTPHPAALGATLTHPHITTDFSESQLELITGVHDSAEACVREITQIHQFVYRHLGEEMLWGSSMPCGLPARDEDIPIGRYGTSNVGRAKSVYRTGLGHRYGKRMQTISGIHYNFSLPPEIWAPLAHVEGRDGDLRAFQDDAYFALIRNFRRRSWLLLYLFGASPAVCSSFVEGREHALEKLAGNTLYLPHATSLRMGRLGYQSDAQASLAVSYNCLESYAGSLHGALTRPFPAYEAIGIQDPSGAYRQLSTTLLQIENEFYGTIRPKRPVASGERPLHALRERGVEYVEVRCMDLDPFKPVGIDEPVMRFLDVFLLGCLLADSPADTPQENVAMSANQHRVATHGREPGLALLRDGDEVSLAEWAIELITECAPVAEAIDAARGGTAYRDALGAAAACLADPARLPSARVLQSMANAHGNSYVRFALATSIADLDAIMALPWSDADEARFSKMAADSIAQQAAIEAADTEPFEAFRLNYMSEAQLGTPGLRTC
ncbi:MAG TPA: glutamate--cysteine ligase [Burkholderiales bacterium]